MPYLTLSGDTIAVAVDSFEREAEVVGSIERAANGKLRAAVTAVKWTWRFETTPLSEVQAAAVRVKYGAVVVAAGDGVVGAPVNVLVLPVRESVIPSAEGKRLVLSIKLVQE